ncbi:MAG: extracellular solute-binding protein [Candidatus Bathyarchaeia archaeon]
MSPHQESILREYKAAFEAYHLARTGETISVEWVDLGGTGNIVRYIESQFAKTPDSVGFDIMYGGGVDPFLLLADEGFLTPYKVPDEILSKIPSNISGIPMYDPEYRWYGAALSGFGIIYNKEVLRREGLPEPQTWEDLTLPKVKGWVGSADPSQSGSTHMMYEIILQGYGWEKGYRISTLIGANCKSFPASSSAIPRLVSAGDLAYGLAIDFYAWAEVARVGADKVSYVMPQGLTVVNPDSIAILKGAPELDLAQEFVEFVLSEQGQKLWMLPAGDPEGPKSFTLGRMSMIPSLYEQLGSRSIVPFNPFTLTSVVAYNATKGSLRYALLNDLIVSQLIDTHDELVRAWESIISTNRTLAAANLTTPGIQQAINKLGEAPLSEAAAEEAAKNWSDPAFRNNYIQAWHVSARQKYADAASQATAAANLAILAATEAQTQLINRLKADAQNNLYMGVGVGVVVGIVIGAAITYSVSRRREVAAVKRTA